MFISEAHLPAHRIRDWHVTQVKPMRRKETYAKDFWKWSFLTLQRELMGTKFYLSLFMNKHEDLEDPANILYPVYILRW